MQQQEVKNLISLIANKEHEDSILKSISRMANSNSIPPSFIRNSSCDYKQLIRALDLLCKFDLKEDFLSGVFFAHGKLSISSNFALLLATRSKTIKTIEEYFFDENSLRMCLENKNLTGEAAGAVCIITTKENLKYERMFRIQDAEKARIVKNVWLTYPNDMLMHKARLRALNSAFPEQIAGVNIYEEKEGMTESLMDEKKIITQEKPIVKKQVKKISIKDLVDAKIEELNPVEAEEKEEPNIPQYIPKDKPIKDKIMDFLSLSKEEQDYWHRVAMHEFRRLEKIGREKGIIKDKVIISDDDLMDNFPAKMDEYINKLQAKIKKHEE